MSPELENECKEEIDKISHHEEMNNWILNVLIQNEIADENINTDTLDCKGIEIEGRIKAIIKYYRYRKKWLPESCLKKYQ